MAARYPTSGGPWAQHILERIVAGKEKRAEEASKEMIETHQHAEEGSPSQHGGA